MAGGWYGIARTATIDRAGAWAELDDGGTAKIVTGVTEIGEGMLTVLARSRRRRWASSPRTSSRRQRHRALAGSRARRRQPADLHDRQRGGARLPRGAQAPGRCDGRGLGRRAGEIGTCNGEIWAEDTNQRMTMGEAVTTPRSAAW